MFDWKNSKTFIKRKSIAVEIFLNPGYISKSTRQHFYSFSRSAHLYLVTSFFIKRRPQNPKLISQIAETQSSSFITYNSSNKKFHVFAVHFMLRKLLDGACYVLNYSVNEFGQSESMRRIFGLIDVPQTFLRFT